MLKGRYIIIVLLSVLLATVCEAQESRRLSAKEHVGLLQDSVAFLQKGLDSLKYINDSLEKVVAGFAPLRDVARDHLILEFGDYSDISFSRMHEGRIDSLLILAGSINDRRLDAFIDKLENSKKNLQSYRDLAAIVSEPYVKSVVDSALVVIEKSFVEPCSELQKKDIEDIRIALIAYPQAIDDVLYVVDWLSDAMALFRPDGDKGSASELAKKIFETQSYMYERSINKVPYLKGLYDSLSKCLEENPLVKSEVEIEIQKLQK